MIANLTKLPNTRFAESWAAIKVPKAVQERLVAQALFSLTARAKLPFEVAPLHGLILLSGPAGTGKTTLARGLANEVARAISPKTVTFAEIDPHALTSAAHGRTQKEMTKLFQQTIPELAVDGPAIILLDEIETMIADRQQLSLDTNPVDVHRATDAALTGLDYLTRECRSVLIFATTNFPGAIDNALLSRADLIENIGLPDADARATMIREVLEHMAREWPAIGKLAKDVRSFVTAAEGLDGRRIRKAIIAAAASSIDTARDPNKLTAQQIVAALQASRTILKEVARESAA